jgi:RNA polymerase sigma-70 factor (ECF subfamily)
MGTRSQGQSEHLSFGAARGERSGDATFNTTHWSAILSARGQDSAAAHKALSELCHVYWYPLYVYIRRRGNAPEEAADLTQAFFARLLEKNYLGDLTPGMGRFRSFLLSAVKHFLANEWDKGQTQKRGGGLQVISLDDDAAEKRFRLEPVDHLSPDVLFDRRWACTVLEQVLSQLRQEFVSSERAALFDQLKIYLSAGDDHASYAEMAARTGLKESTVKVTVHRLRRRYGELLRSHIAETVADPREIEDEVRHLISVLSN